MVTSVTAWDIGQDIGPYMPLLNLPYNYHRMPDAKFKPVEGLVDVLTPYRHEAALTSRLDHLVFPTLFRVQRYIAYLYLANHLAWPANHIPLFSDVGSTAWYNQFLPDRCATPSDYASNLRTRCVGDIKPSYKFQSSWRTDAMNQYYIRRSGVKTEYFQVLSQLMYYMCEIGDHGNGKKVRYGYIISDLEVVLFRRDPGQRNQLAATVGYPLRGGENFEISGFTALVFVHLLAGNDVVGMSLCA